MNFYFGSLVFFPLVKLNHIYFSHRTEKLESLVIKRDDNIINKNFWWCISTWWRGRVGFRVGFVARNNTSHIVVVLGTICQSTQLSNLHWVVHKKILVLKLLSHHWRWFPDQWLVYVHMIQSFRISWPLIYNCI